jgi:hypothetical protein
MSRPAAYAQHFFMNDLQEAYKISKFAYDNDIQRTLFKKLPPPTNDFERAGLSGIPSAKNATEERIYGQTTDALLRQFFHLVKTGGAYCAVDEIKKQFGQSPRERLGISSGGYYRLFIAYWTLKAKLRKYQESNINIHGTANIYYLDALIADVESILAGLFFPTPGPFGISESERRREVQGLLRTVAPGMTIRDIYEGADSKKAGWPVLK